VFQKANRGISMSLDENKIDENPQRTMNINENQSKSMKINEN